MRRMKLDNIGDGNPWPSEIEEIATGEEYNRRPDAESPVEVRKIAPVLDEKGNDAGGRVVTFREKNEDGGGN